MSLHPRDGLRGGQLRKLGELLTFRNDVVHPKDRPTGTATFVGLEHIERDTGIRIGAEQINLSEMTGRRARFYAGDIVYGYLRPYLNKVWRADFDGICSVDQYVFQILPEVDPSYITYFLRSQSFLESAPIDNTPGQLPRIRSGEIAETAVFLPPLDEQRRIAAFLDQADELRRKRRAALDRLEQLTRSDFETAFVKVEADSWKELTVADFAMSIRTGPFGSQLLHSEFTDEGVAILGIDNAVTNAFGWSERRFVSQAKYQELQRYRVYPRDVLVTIMGTCGRAAIVPDDIPLAINTKHLCCLTLDQERCAPEFLHAALLMHPSVLHQLGVKERGAVMPGLNMGLIKETRLKLPPIELQRAFAARVAEIDKLRASHRAHLAKLDALFASLQHRAFRGEL